MTISSDPTDAAVIVQWASVSGNVCTVTQASGVLIAPDEVLTADHAVLDALGHVASGVTVSGTAAGQNFSAAAAGIHASPAADWTHLSSAAGDFALIHLATAIGGAPIMALGADFPGGGVTVTGYPMTAGGARVSLGEALSPVSGLAGVLQGTPLDVAGDAHGSSGGPAWHSVGGTPTVVGLAQSVAGSTGYFFGLTAADVAEIDGWMAADHAAAAAPAPATSASAPAAAAPAAAPLPDLGAALSSAAGGLPAFASHPAADAALSRVAATLARDAAMFGPDADFGDVAAQALSDLGDNGQRRNLAAALLEGTVWGHVGGAPGAAVAAVAGDDPGIMNYAAARYAVRAGALAGQALLADGR